MRKTRTLFLIVLVLSCCFVFLKPATATGDSWLTNWAYRKSHVVNSAAGAGLNYQVKIVVINGTSADSGGTVYENNGAKADWSDIRFTASDGLTLLDAWNESQTNGVNVTCWVEISDNLTAGASTIYFYWGNSAASAYWNGEHTFLFFDHFDFPNNSLNTSLWSSNAPTVTVASSVVTVSTTSSANWYGVISKYSMTYGRWRSLAQQPDTNRYEIFGFSSETDTASSTVDLVYFYRNPSFYYAATHKHPSSDSSFKYSGLTTMQTYEIDWCSVNATYYMADTLLGNVATNIPAVALNATMNVVASGTVKADWVFLAKYVFPEPAHGAWGSLEYASAFIVTLYFTAGVSVMTVNGTTAVNGSSYSYYRANNTLVFLVSGLHDFAFENWTYDGSVDTSNPFSLVFETNLTVWCNLYNLTAYYQQGYSDGYTSGYSAASNYSIARFDFNPTNPAPGDLVTFNATQSYNTTTVAFNWDFGDGNITLVSDSFLVLHSFAANTTYIVSLELHGTATGVNSTMFFRSVNVTTATGGGGLSRTEPEDLASLVIAGFIGVVLLIGVIVIVTRGRRK
jgi:hypothetical protein